jgi:tripartite-type tricarboxylate transporter receptor subunit TctC
VQKALNNPGVQEKLQKLGVQPMPMTPDEFQKFFTDDVAAMIKLAKDADIKPTD